MVVAIDGPAGVGKSTIAKKLAEKLGFYYLNSGNFYRGVTYAILQEKATVDDEEENLRIAEKTQFDVVNGRFFVDGKDVQDELHSPKIDLNASYVSSNPAIREIVNKRIYELTGKLSIICEGRDMTTVVFPDAEHKFFFDASPEVRAKRRFEEHPDGMSFEEVLEEINKRDENDRNKPVGGLKIAQDAIYVDTSYLTIDEVCAKVLQIIINNNYKKK